LEQAQERQTVLELAQTKRQNAHDHDAPSCPLSKLITEEASQGGMITFTTTRIIRQHDIVSSTCLHEALPVARFLKGNGPWTGGEIEPALKKLYESQGYKPTATCKECGFKQLCALTSFTPTEVPLSPPSPPPS